jgi:hypothetical protein
MHADGGDLYLQVTVGKEGQINKSWLFRFERGGKERQMGLGSLNTIGLKEAREKAKRCRQVLLNGKEVRNAERAAAKAGKSKSATFEWCSVQYMKLREAGWRNAKHRAQWTSTLRDYVYPVIGKVSVRRDHHLLHCGPWNLNISSICAAPLKRRALLFGSTAVGGSMRSSASRRGLTPISISP